MEHEHNTSHSSSADKQPFSTPVAIVIAGALIAGSLLYALGYAPNHLAKSAPVDTTAEQKQLKDITPVTDADHIRGDIKNAELVMVEYSDLQCPYCSQFHPVIKKLSSEYGSKVAWVYRQFPLSQIHPQALPAALASECVASAKGNEAFWRFIDGTFVNQQQIGIALFKKLAAQEGISGPTLDACLAKQDTAKIEAQYNEAVAAGGQGTPFTVIVDKKGKTVGTFPGAYQYEQAKAQIDALLAAK